MIITVVTGCVTSGAELPRMARPGRSINGTLYLHSRSVISGFKRDGALMMASLSLVHNEPKRLEAFLFTFSSFFFLYFYRSCRVGSGARWRSGCSADARYAPCWCVMKAESKPQRPLLPITQQKMDYASALPIGGSADLFWMTALHR